MRIGALAVVVVLAGVARDAVATCAPQPPAPRDWQMNVPIDTDIVVPCAHDGVYVLEGDATDEVFVGACVGHVVTLEPRAPLLARHAYTVRTAGERVLSFVTSDEVSAPRPPRSAMTQAERDLDEQLAIEENTVRETPRLVRATEVWTWVFGIMGLVLLWALVGFARAWHARSRPPED
jgi:hypothetical protein